MTYNEILQYNREQSAACFWSGHNEYQDHAGNWRALDDTEPLVIVEMRNAK